MSEHLTTPTHGRPKLHQAWQEPELRWPDGRRIITERIFPNLPEIQGKPDWVWFVEDWDLGDPSGSYFQTKEDALADARIEIKEKSAELYCPDADHHGWWGCRSCGLQPLSD